MEKSIRKTFIKFENLDMQCCFSYELYIDINSVHMLSNSAKLKIIYLKLKEDA